jgi:hypothetical protein
MDGEFAIDSLETLCVVGEQLHTISKDKVLAGDWPSENTISYYGAPSHSFVLSCLNETITTFVFGYTNLSLIVIDILVDIYLNTKISP